MADFIPNPGVRIDGKLASPRASTRKNLSTDMKVGRQNVFDYSDATISDGTTDARTAILAADAVGPVLLPPGIYAIASNMTLSNNIMFEPGAKLKPANAVIITLSSGYIAEDTQHVFDLSASGTVVIPSDQRFTVNNVGSVGDNSTDNLTLFQNAITIAKASNAEIIVPSGTYILSSGLSPGPATNLNFKGQNKQKSILKFTTGGFTFQVSTGVSFDNITLQGSNLDIPAIKYYTTSSDLTVTNCNFKNWGNTGNFLGVIDCVDVQGITITGCKFSSNIGDTNNDIRFVNCSEINTTGNTMLSSNGIGIAHADTVSSLGVFTFSNNIIRNKTVHGMILAYGDMNLRGAVTGNSINNCGINGIYVQAGIGVTSAGELSITGNTVTYCGGNDGSGDNAGNSGIHLSGNFGGTCSGNTIHRAGYDLTNTLRGTGRGRGILISNGANWTISGNTITYSAMQAIGTNDSGYLRNVLIDGNTIVDATDSLIWIAESTAGERSVVITNNTLTCLNKDCDGIYFYDTNGNSEVIIKGNVFTGLKAGTNKSAVLWGVERYKKVEISNSTFKNWDYAFTSTNNATNPNEDWAFGRCVYSDFNTYDNVTIPFNIRKAYIHSAVGAHNRFINTTPGFDSKLVPASFINGRLEGYFVSGLPNKKCRVGDRLKPLSVVDGDDYEWFVRSSDQPAATAFVVSSGNNFTDVAHGLSQNTVLRFTGGSLPTPVVAGKDYFVVSIPNADTFTIGEALNGTTLTLTSTGSGNYQVQEFTPTWQSDIYDWLNRKDIVKYRWNGDGNNDTIGDPTDLMNNSDMVWNGVIAYANGPSGKGDGKAFQLNGTNSYLTGPTDQYTDTSVFTVCGWVKLDTTVGSQCIASARDGTGGWAIVQDGGTLYLVNTVGYVAISYGLELTSGVWAHMALVFNTTNSAVYVNGVRRTNVFEAEWVTAGSNFLTLGFNDLSANQFVNGELFDWRIYERALTESQLLGLVNGPSFGSLVSKSELPGVHNPFDYTLATISDGTTNARTAILAADNNGPVYLKPGTYAIASNMTLTNNIKFETGAKLKPANGVVVTLDDGYTAESTQHIFDISAGGSFQISNQRTITPRQFGALGNGITTDDDSAAIQAAITEAVRSNATLDLTAGHFFIGSTLAINCTGGVKTIEMLGAGMSRTTIQAMDGFNGPLLQLTNTNVGSSQYLHQSKFQDFFLYGTKSNGTRVDVVLDLPAVIHTTFSRLRVAGALRIATKLGYNHSNHWVDCLIQPALVPAGTNYNYGIVCNNAVNYANEYTGLTLLGCDVGYLATNGGQGNTFTNCRPEDCRVFGMYWNGGNAWAFNGYLEACGYSTDKHKFITINNNDATLVHDGPWETQGGFCFNGTSRDYSEDISTTATGTIGTPTVVVASATGLQKGGRVEVVGGDVGAATLYTRISSISGTTITLEDNLGASVSGVTFFQPIQPSSDVSSAFPPTNISITTAGWATIGTSSLYVVASAFGAQLAWPGLGTSQNQAVIDGTNPIIEFIGVHDTSSDIQIIGGNPPDTNLPSRYLRTHRTSKNETNGSPTLAKLSKWTWASKTVAHVPLRNFVLLSGNSWAESSLTHQGSPLWEYSFDTSSFITGTDIFSLQQYQEFQGRWVAVDVDFICAYPVYSVSNSFYAGGLWIYCTTGELGLISDSSGVNGRPPDIGELLVTGSITTGTSTLTVSSGTGFKIGDIVTVAGAGTGGKLLVATLTNVSGVTLTLNTTAGTTVSSVNVLRCVLQTRTVTFKTSTTDTNMSIWLRGYVAEGSGGNKLFIKDVRVREVGNPYYDQLKNISQETGVKISGKLTLPEANTRKNLLTDLKFGKQNVFNYTDSTISDGTTNARTAILAADAIGPVLLPPGTYAIASNMTLSNNITFDSGAKLKPASGVVITLSGGYTAEETQHVFDISAGGSFIVRKVSKLSSAHFGTVSDYAYPNVGTDNSPALQALFNTANEMAQAVGTLARKQILVYVPPGSYRCNTPLTSGNFSNLNMSGVFLVYFGSRVGSGAFLTIGDSDGEIETGIFYLPMIQGSPSDFNMPLNEQEFVGIRIKNCGSSMFFCDSVTAFGIGYQLTCDGDSYLAHNTFINQKMSVVKTGMQILGTSPGGWVNENTFIGFNWTSTSSENSYGTLKGIHITSQAGGYNGQNNNRFYSPCFQPAGRPSGYDLIVGRSVVQHDRYFNLNNMQEYVCDVAGTVVTVPTNINHEQTSPDASGVVFTHVGPYFRSPIHHDKAGSWTLVSGARHEYGDGPFAMITNSSGASIRGNQYEIYTLAAPNDRAIPMIDEYSTSELNELCGNNNVLRVYGEVSDTVVTLNETYKRFIGSATAMSFRGMVLFDYATNLLSNYVESTNYILCKSSLSIQPDRALGVVVDLTNCRAVQCANYNGGAYVNPFTWSNYVAPLDANNKFVSIPDTYTLSAISNGSFSSGKWNIGGEAIFFARGNNNTVKHAFVGFSGGSNWAPTSCMEVSAIPGRFLHHAQLSVVTPDIGRTSYGTPTVGYFETFGEYITNLNQSAGQPKGWRVVTAGILAPTWAGNTVVIEGELRKSGNNVYAALSAGTTGNPGTAPTGTSSSVSDGVINWEYIGTVALLEADFPPEDSIINVTLNSDGTGSDWYAANTYISSMELIGDFDITFNWVDRQQNQMAGVCTDIVPLVAGNYNTPEFGIYWINDTTVQVWKSGVSANHTISTWGNGFVRLIRIGTVIQLYINDEIVSGATDLSFSTATMRRFYSSIAATASEVTIYTDYETPLYQGSSLDSVTAVIPSSDGTEVLSFSATPVFRWLTFPQINKSITLTANVTGAVLLSKTPGNYYIIVVQDGSGGHTFSIATTVIGTAPTINSSAGASTIVGLRWTGASWFYI